jgi:RimJ/RimL family protein N-acetyltransferase
MILHRRHGAIGVVAAADYSPLHRRAEFLIGLFNPSHYHCGYSIEASLMLGDLIFNQYNLHRFYAYSYDYNDLAHRTLCSGGFLPEGSMKEHVFDQASGRFVDLVIFGMTVDQFRTNRRLARLSRRLLGRDICQPPPQQEAPQASPPSFQHSGVRILRR